MWQGVELCVKLRLLGRTNETETHFRRGRLLVTDFLTPVPNTSWCDYLVYLHIQHNQPSAVRESFAIDPYSKTGSQASLVA